MRARLATLACAAGFAVAQAVCAVEPPPAPPVPAPAEQPAPVVRPGKAKGAWQGEYPVPKPPLPEGPAAPPAEPPPPPPADRPS